MQLTQVCRMPEVQKSTGSGNMREDIRDIVRMEGLVARLLQEGLLYICERVVWRFVRVLPAQNSAMIANRSILPRQSGRYMLLYASRVLKYFY